MTDYSKFSVHKLVLVIAKQGMLALQRGVTGDDGVSLVTLESALRKAVIREAKPKTTKKPRKKTVGGTGMSENEYWHWQHDSYPN